LRRSGTVDPDKTENEIKENTKPAIPSIAAAPTAPAIAPAASTAPAAAPVAPAAAPATSAATPASTGTAIPGLSS